MPTSEQPRHGYSVESYFGLVSSGELAADDHVELLEGVIVAEPPQDPPHASATARLDRVLRAAVGDSAVIRVQVPFIAGPFSAPEPDVAVVPGDVSDYDQRHPTSALLIVEVASSSLPQDRLSKQRIYAAGGCPEYWIVNLRDRCVEVYRQPDMGSRVYAERRVVDECGEIDIVAFRPARIRVADILPARPIE
jgi:Uma2 family endonuclease